MRERVKPKSVLLGPPADKRQKPLGLENLHLEEIVKYGKSEHVPLWCALLPNPDDITPLPEDVVRAKADLSKLFRDARQDVIQCHGMSVSEARERLRLIRQVIAARSAM